MKGITSLKGMEIWKDAEYFDLSINKVWSGQEVFDLGNLKNIETFFEPLFRLSGLQPSGNKIFQFKKFRKCPT